jgi:hypothetical protein
LLTNNQQGDLPIEMTINEIGVNFGLIGADGFAIK